MISAKSEEKSHLLLNGDPKTKVNKGLVWDFGIAQSNLAQPDFNFIKMLLNDQEGCVPSHGFWSIWIIKSFK